MHSSHYWGCVRSAPIWLWKWIIFFCIVSKIVCYRTRHLLHLSRMIEQVHLVIPVSHLVWDAACPSFDFVELELLFIVAGFADIDLLIGRESSRAAFVVTSEEHDEASVYNLINLVVPILSGFDDLVLEEVLLMVMHGLLRMIVPAGIDPFLSLLVLPCAVYLCNNG